MAASHRHARRWCGRTRHHAPRARRGHPRPGMIHVALAGLPSRARQTRALVALIADLKDLAVGTPAGSAPDAAAIGHCMAG
eukprot:3841316-Prymnesium_polylepis.1